MKTTINQSQFIDAFHNMGRSENFSYEGLTALYEYLEQLEEDTGQDLELDVIAICCDFTEYENMAELKREYDIENMEELEDNTTVLHIEGTERFIIQNY